MSSIPTLGQRRRARLQVVNGLRSLYNLAPATLDILPDRQEEVMKIITIDDFDWSWAVTIRTDNLKE